MNEKIILRVLREKKLNYNDLNEKEHEKYKKLLFDLDKTKSSEEMKKLCKSLKSSLRFMRLKPIGKEITIEKTRLRFSNDPYQIPKIVNRIMEYLLEQDLRVEGIFKKSPHFDRIEQAYQRYMKCLEDDGDLHFYMREFDVLEVTSAFKKILSSLGVPIFSSSFCALFCKIARANLSDEERKFAMKIVVFHLPILNLDTLQSVVIFLVMVHEIVVDANTVRLKQVTLNGISNVVTPRLFCTKDIKDPEDLVDLSRSTSFLIRYFVEIISVDSELKKKL